MKTSAFHAGEIEMQGRAGLADRMETIGNKVIRSHLIEQHRDFYSLLSMVLLAAHDSHNRLWASIQYGKPGFIHSPDEMSLQLKTHWHPCDPLYKQLKAEQSLALLGIELPTRRRNRANGIITGLDDKTLRLEIEQSFGNCPKYIQTREICAVGQPQAHHKWLLHSFNADVVERIQSADCFFIASHSGANNSRNEKDGGLDISHRGGTAGFVKVLNERQVVWADFPGNNFFNTLGNLLCSDSASLLFVDFESGDHLYLSGRASVLFAGKDRLYFDGFERNVCFELEQGYLVPKASPLRWQRT